MAAIKIEETETGASTRLQTPSPTDPLLLDPQSALAPTRQQRSRCGSKASIGIFGRDGLEDFEVIDRDPHTRQMVAGRVEDSGDAVVDGEKARREEYERRGGLLGSLGRYPKAVFFMLGNEFCERFSFYGMRAILTLYLIIEHGFQESTASLLFHAFISLSYFSPLFGSIAADNYFGRFRVILWVSLIYVFGHVLLSFGAVPYFPHGLRSVIDCGGLVVIALATGGIKPCVSVFAADQFDENMQIERAQFFSFFYFAINAGSLLAIMTTPILRGRVQCFGSQYCFPLAFGVPGVLMLISFLIFISGYPLYKITPAGKGNVIWKVCKCIGCALHGKICAILRGRDSKAHWLDYAAPKYHDTLIVGVKSLVAVSTLFIPVVFFWALFDQQGSTWVLQARRMDGRVGPITILPDQMNVVNPLMIIALVPLFEAFIYPACRRLFVVTPLRKMAAGGLLAALAFIIAGVLQLRVNDTLEPKPADRHVFVHRIGVVGVALRSNDGRPLAEGKNEWPAGNYTLRSSQVTREVELLEARCGYIVGVFSEQSITVFPYSCEKSENGMTKVYLLVEPSSSLINTTLYVLDENEKVNTKTIIEEGRAVDIKPGFISSPNYVISYGNCGETDAGQVRCKTNVQFFAQMGAAHVLNLERPSGSSEVALPSRDATTVIVRPNSVNMLWQIPQFFIITLGEVLFSVTGLEFSYSQAAPTMKSVLQAVWLLTIFFGNVIDMGISGTHIIHEPASEFFLYAFLMLIVICIFIAISMNYTYVNEHQMAEAAAQEEEAELEAEKAMAAAVAEASQRPAAADEAESNIHKRANIASSDGSASAKNTSATPLQMGAERVA